MSWRQSEGLATNISEEEGGQPCIRLPHLKNQERNFCLASIFDLPSLGRCVGSFHNPADITLDQSPKQPNRARYQVQKWGKMWVCLCVGCVCMHMHVCTLHNSGNLYSTVLRIKQVNLAFSLFVHIWCLEDLENPILSHQLIS